MDVSIAVPSPRVVHSETPSSTTTTAFATSLPTPQPPDSSELSQQTMVHARLDARDVVSMAAAVGSAATAGSDSGQEDEEELPDSSQQSRSSRSSRSSTPSPVPRSVPGDDVERFDGKIVYNPDGSAYIIEESSRDGVTLDNCQVQLPKLEGAIIVDGRRGGTTDLEQNNLPHIARALYVSRDASKTASSSTSLDAPVMHSFRVYSARNNSNDDSLQSASILPSSAVPIKPILMCFICKLSFGLAKSLTAHATGEHALRLDEEEKRILSRDNTSAIVQLVGKSKEAVISFLEPVVHQDLPPAALNVSVKSEAGGDDSFESKETALLPGSFQMSPPGSTGNNNNNSSTSNNNGRASSLLSSPSSTTTPSPLSPPPVNLVNNNNNNNPVTGLGVNVNNLLLPAGCFPPGHPFGLPVGADGSGLMSPLGSAAAAAAAMAALATRNSCKTLKCPKCNWHYKYQETLEIHMKEKHPESETSCLYCLTGQPHPRLARGETYTCGYKPYRCEVCNYSTTTKGNLSIHMQSDKHLNNAQELHQQNNSNGQSGSSSSAAGQGTNTSGHNTSSESMSGASPVKTSGSQQHSSPPAMTSPALPKSGINTPAGPLSGSSSVAKPTWRCDVCNYETNVARNLRIHMTSEKHTHNMIMLQQNVKRMQQLSTIQGQQDPSGGGQEAAMADMAYQQALFIQMMTGGQLPSSAEQQGWSGNSGINQPASSSGMPMADTGLNPETMEPPPEPLEANPSHIFQCLVCSVFGNDGAEVLASHVSADRSRQREHEALLLIGGHYLCRLCAYKTTLKANFQLHCKTDKHLQRLQHATHIQEGGPRNDWKLQYVTSTTNPVQLRCNVCDYYTNSVHKLQVHALSPRHQLAVDLFRHLNAEEASLPSNQRSSVTYQCRLCQLDCPNKSALLQHARTLRHCQMEQLADIQRQRSGQSSNGPLELRDLFVVLPSDSSDSADTTPPSINGTEAGAQLGQGSTTSPTTTTADPQGIKTESKSNETGLTCPLCQNRFSDRGQVEQHAATVHNVNAEGLERLMLLVEQANWLNAAMQQQQKGSSTVLDEGEETGEASAGATSTTPLSRPGLTSGATVSERHAYKYRCPQCSLAFKTLDKLQLHSQYHVIRDATKCPLCGRSFRSILSLQKHLESSHAELTDEEANVLRQSLLSHPLLLSGLAGQASEAAISEYLRRESVGAELSDEETELMDQQDSMMQDGEDGVGDEPGTGLDVPHQGTPLEEYLNSASVAEETYPDPVRRHKCHRCKMAFTSQAYLTSHNKTMQHRKGEKLHYPMEKYLDPNRPFKCDVCKESFTQKNILLVHYNSVSHLHKLKRAAAAAANTSAVTEQQSVTPLPPPAALGNVSRPERPVTANSTGSSSTLTGDLAGAGGNKPWKCNICKVAYSQGSTLDIHLRSVLHQTRASKLQELAAAGHIDLTRPLIEQPSGNTGANTSSNSNSPESPAGSRKPGMTSPAITTSTTTTQEPDSSAGNQLAMALAQLYGLSPEQLFQHQQLQQYYSAAAGFPAAAAGADWAALINNKDRSESPLPAEETGVNNNNNKLGLPARRSSRMLKHLLGSYGFELVMQFNECHQKQRNHQKNSQGENQASSAAAAAATPSADPAEEENKENALEGDGTESNKAPEIQRCVCPLCHKSFSSIWVLKAHSEEVHRQMVPPHCVEQCADELIKRTASLAAASSNQAPPLSPVERLPPPGNIDRNEEESQAQSETAVPTPTASSTPISSSAVAEAAASQQQQQQQQAAAQQVAVAAAQQAQQNAQLVQQMSDMQGVLNAMGLASQLAAHQQQFNPMMMGLAGLAGGFNMPAAALAAMNMQPPLMNPFSMMTGHFDPAFQAAMAAHQGNPFLQSAMDPTGMLAKQQQLLQQQSGGPSQSQQSNGPIQQQQQQQQSQSSSGQQQSGGAGQQQQKRARTRISDDQLKILRAHFDINNSPPEETIAEMARQSGLPPKVIKHWFRNTLFKERQRNKDSPYNFSNPPSTTLNLEEYEKTGETKVTPLKTEEQMEIQRALVNSRPAPSAPKVSKQSALAQQQQQQQLQQQPSPIPEVQVKKEVAVSEMMDQLPPSMEEANSSSRATPSHMPFQQRSGSPSGMPSNLSLASLISSQLNVDTKTGVVTAGNMFPPRPAGGSALTSPAPPVAGMSGLSPGRMNSDQGPFNFFTTSTPLPMAPLTPPGGGGGGNSSSGGGGPGSSTGKRANRTRFTDYQIKVLQEFFENNAYPKDDDLEYLSKLLALSPRVIVVWFQNARQKARKVYENQPPVTGSGPSSDPSAPGGSGSATPGSNSGADDGSGRFQRTPGLNYQCKKCLLVFQRYYELIRHQKTHCFKEEDAKRSAVAQAAAAQAAACFSSSDNDNSNSSSLADASVMSGTASSSCGAPPVVPKSSSHHVEPAKRNESTQNKTTPESSSYQSQQQNDSAFHCEQCGLTFARFDLWREHQIVHIMNPDLFGVAAAAAAGGKFGGAGGMESQYAALLQQHQAAVVAAAQLSAGSGPPMTPPASSSSNPLIPSGSKRKLEQEEDEERNGGGGGGSISGGGDGPDGQPRDKRLRTTILPEQLDFLYQQYQLESNPSRKMLETISREVGLKKRVVQVWFQNTRARERKGQFRAHAQVINKRCPFCPALFKVKSALESHLAGRHPDQLAKGEVNIDALPDMTDDESDPGGINSSPHMGLSATASGGNNADAIQEALTKRLSAVSNYQQSMASLSMLSSLYQQGFVAPLPGFDGKAEDALKRYANDYLANAAAAAASSGGGASGPTPTNPTGELPLDLSRPLPLQSSSAGRPESSMHSDVGTDDMDYFDESNPSSPLPYGKMGSHSNNASMAGSTSGGGQAGSGNKRFRTQMSAVQVRVMKSLFSDYKTPTMAECEALGREIGLPKRVVQVWFQNARAKEKKNKLNAAKASGTEMSESTKQPEGCDLCDFKYSHKYAVQDHIFTHQHIERVKIHVAEQQQLSGQHQKSSSGAQQDAEASASSSPGEANNSTSNPAEAAQLEALLLHQLYGLGYGSSGMNPAAILAAAAAASASSYSGWNNQQGGGQQQQQQQQQGGAENYLLAMLQRSPSALQQIAKTFAESGVSEARFTLDGSDRSSMSEHFNARELEGIRTTPMEVGVLCKACQTLYGSEAAVAQHQRNCDAIINSGGSGSGATRLILLQHECLHCDDKFPTLSELRQHFNGEQHRLRAGGEVSSPVGGAQQLPPTSSSPSSAGLSSQIEDVVKQLTALAQATGSTTGKAESGGNNCDTNANIAAQQQQQRKAATY